MLRKGTLIHILISQGNLHSLGDDAGGRAKRRN